MANLHINLKLVLYVGVVCTVFLQRFFSIDERKKLLFHRILFITMTYIHVISDWYM